METGGRGRANGIGTAILEQTAFDRYATATLTSRDDLRKIVKQPSRYVENKVIDHIDPLSARFIAASPLAILGTRRADGGVDQTPRGDPPGFVKVLDQNTLALPDRPGNNRMGCDRKYPAG